MKKLQFFFSLITLLLFVGCSSNDDTTMTKSAGNIIPDFTFTNDEANFTFTNLTEGATSYRWDFGDLSFYCDKENPSYRYVTAGGELQVTLTSMDEEGHEASITKTIIAPEVIDLDIAIDGNLEDWSSLDYLYEESDAASIQKIKVWGKGDNVNIYLEGNANMKMELIDIFINSDGNSTTGFLSWQWPEGSGAEFLFEGPLLTASGAFFQHTDPAGGWGWSELAGSGANMTSSGIISLDAETNAIEFSIPKVQLGSLGSTISFSFSEMTSGWAAVGSFPTVTATSKFVTYEVPIEAIGVCE